MTWVAAGMLIASLVVLGRTIFLARQARKILAAAQETNAEAQRLLAEAQRLVDP